MPPAIASLLAGVGLVLYSVPCIQRTLAGQPAAGGHRRTARRLPGPAGTVTGFASCLPAGWMVPARGSA